MNNRLVPQILILPGAMFSALLLILAMPTPVQADGPISYWKLDETAAPFDDYFSTQDGVCAGNCPAATTGQINKGQEFNGSNTGIDIPAHPAFDWSMAGDFSIEFWMQGIPGQTCASADQIMVGRVDNSTAPLWSLSCSKMDGYARFHLSDTNGISATLESTKAITNGVWHHIAGVRDNGVNRLYLDGQEVASTTIAYSGDFASPSAIKIGWLNSGTGFHFDGIIDEVAIHDEALSDVDIKTHYYLSRDYADACSTPIRIMPLGNSITRGNSSGVNDSTKQISYRKDLWGSLIAADYNIDFVGTLTNGQFYAGFDPEHEGHSGWRDDQLVAEIYDNGGANWLDTLRLSGTPVDVVLLHIGTNDINAHDPNDVDELLDEINQYEADNNTSVTVIVARMIHRRNYSSGAATHSFNDTTEAVALERLNNGDKIIIVDMENGAGIDYSQYPPGDMWDWGHPYATGYTKMAAVWYDALDDFLPVCIQEAPTIVSSPVTTAIVDKLYTYDVAATGSPVPTYTLTISPTGMTIITTTGLISWTPIATGSFNVTVEAANSAGTDTQDFAINVSDGSISYKTHLPIIIKSE